MWQNFVLTLAGLLNLGASDVSSPVYNQETVVLPAGEVEITTDYEWNGVALQLASSESWPYIAYQAGDGEFYYLHAGEDVDGTLSNDTSELMFFGVPRKTLVLRTLKPLEVRADFFNTTITGENLEAKFEAFDDDSLDNPETGLAYSYQTPKYISRAQWGANEALRLTNIRQGFRTSLPEAQNLSNSLKPKIIQRQASNGAMLRWPLEQNQTIRKLIVHHTGEVTDATRHPMELMRAIYYYHTITRGWGDIGYHYVVDWEGNIYEGRAGGNQIVGAHTAYYNVGTIGIALMGNFELEKPTQRQVDILKLILADHANRFKIDLTQKSSWLAQHSHNVAGHRDVAVHGHGTLCPGRYLHELLPEITRDAKILARELRTSDRKSGLDFLSKSRAAPKIQRRLNRDNNQPDLVTLSKLITKKTLKRGDRSILDVYVQNNSEKVWRRGDKLTVSNIPQGLQITSFSAVRALEPGESGIFRARLLVDSTPNGVYQLRLTPKILGLKLLKTQSDFVLPLQVSGSKDLLSKRFILNPTTTVSSRNTKLSFSTPIHRTNFKTSAPKVENFGPEIKVKLSYFDQAFAVLSGNQTVKIYDQGKTIATVQPGRTIKITPEAKTRRLVVASSGRTWQLRVPQFITSGVLKVGNYDRGLGSNPYNQFRRQVNAHLDKSGELYLVNQLPLEEYLWGLAEEPVTEPTAKKHAIHILARSYGLVYSGDRRKFRTSHYDLEDSPKTSQFYLGYDWERYHHLQKDLVDETKGQVIAYQGKPAIGPYFTQSSGRSSDAWVRQYPWAKGRELPFDKGLVQKGHGIGLSGNSARALAKQGKNPTEILNYFFPDVTVKKVY